MLIGLVKKGDCFLDKTFAAGGQIKGGSDHFAMYNVANQFNIIDLFIYIRKKNIYIYKKEKKICESWRFFKKGRK